MQNPDVSIIIVSYNTKELLKNCLNSIFQKTNSINFDVYVIDNNSVDNSCEMIKNDFLSVNLIENNENLGFGKACNIAIKKSKAKYVFLLNSDTTLINNAVKILFDFMEQDSQIAATGGNLYNLQNKNIHSYGYFKTLKSKLIKVLKLGFLYPDINKIIKDKGENINNELKEVDIITGADLMLRKEVLDKIGLFDEDFFLYDEETELQYRIKKLGYKIFINPESKIYHLENMSCQNRIIARTYKMESEILCYKKCYGSKYIGFYKFICCIPNIPRLIFHPKLIYKSFCRIGKI